MLCANSAAFININYKNYKFDVVQQFSKKGGYFSVTVAAGTEECRIVIIYERSDYSTFALYTVLIPDFFKKAIILLVDFK